MTNSMTPRPPTLLSRQLYWYVRVPRWARVRSFLLC